MNKFNFNQKVSSSLALVLVFLLSFVVAWFALSVGNNIIASAPYSVIFNPAERTPQRNP
jgi:hypothetical protein